MNGRWMWKAVIMVVKEVPSAIITALYFETMEREEQMCVTIVRNT
jgi:hypothetical protein